MLSLRNYVQNRDDWAKITACDTENVKTDDPVVLSDLKPSERKFLVLYFMLPPKLIRMFFLSNLNKGSSHRRYTYIQYCATSFNDWTFLRERILISGDSLEIYWSYLLKNAPLSLLFIPLAHSSVKSHRWELTVKQLLALECLHFSLGLPLDSTLSCSWPNWVQPERMLSTQLWKISQFIVTGLLHSIFLSSFYFPLLFPLLFHLRLLQLMDLEIFFKLQVQVYIRQHWFYPVLYFPPSSSQKFKYAPNTTIANKKHKQDFYGNKLLAF